MKEFKAMNYKWTCDANGCTISAWCFQIKKVIFNPPATIVLWNDGSKTVVNARNEPYDKEKGLAMAICKRVYGNNNKYYELFKDLISEGDCNEKKI